MVVGYRGRDPDSYNGAARARAGGPAAPASLQRCRGGECHVLRPRHRCLHWYSSSGRWLRCLLLLGEDGLDLRVSGQGCSHGVDGHTSFLFAFPLV